MYLGPILEYRTDHPIFQYRTSAYGLGPILEYLMVCPIFQYRTSGLRPIIPILDQLKPRIA